MSLWSVTRYQRHSCSRQEIGLKTSESHGRHTVTAKL